MSEPCKCGCGMQVDDTEIDRLRALNAELVVALKGMVKANEKALCLCEEHPCICLKAREVVQAIISKAEPPQQKNDTVK